MGVKKVVTVGGGTGQSVVLTALKKIPNLQISAIVSMADSGGTNGMLRRVLGAHPPSDARQCLLALAKGNKKNKNLEELMNYRYEKGPLRGHNFGSIFIAMLEKITGDFSRALGIISKILNIRGKIIPVTLSNAELALEFASRRKIFGEHEIDTANFSNKKVKRIFYKNKVTLNPEAGRAIVSADYLIISPGDFYTSLAPNFIVAGFQKAVQSSKAKIIVIQNVKNNQKDYGSNIESYLGRKTSVILKGLKSHTVRPARADVLARSTLRHDPIALARALKKVLK